MDEKKFDEPFPKELLQKYLGKNYGSVDISNENFIRRILKDTCDSKSGCLKVVSFLNENNLTEYKEVLLDILQHDAFRKEGNKKYSIYSYATWNDLTTVFKWMHELSKKDPFNFDFINKIEKDDWSRLFNLHSEDIQAINSRTLEEYIYFVRESLVPIVNDLEKRVNIEYLENSKSSLNALVTLYGFQPGKNTLKKFIEMFPLINSQDPSLSGVPIKRFLDKIYKNVEHKELYKKIKGLISCEEDLFEVKEKVFVISLNVEAITRKRLSLKKEVRFDDNSGIAFVNTMQELFLKAKELGMKKFDCFVNQGEDIKKITHHVFRKDLSDTVKAYIIRDFTFSYENEEDKKKKMEFFKDVFNVFLKEPIKDKDYLFGVLEKIDTNNNLKLSLNTDEVRSIVKKRKL